jgi:AraC family transcriptional regulator
MRSLVPQLSARPWGSPAHIQLRGPSRPRPPQPLKLLGGAQGWALPAIIWDAPLGFECGMVLPFHAISVLREAGGVERLNGRFAGRKARAHREEVTITPAGELCRYGGAAGTAAAQLLLDPGFLASVARDPNGPAGGSGELRDDVVFTASPALREMVESYVTRATDAQEPPSRLEMDARAIVIALEALSRHGARGAAAPPATHPLGERRLRRVCDHIEANLANDLSLAELAQVACLSPQHFARAFRRATGMPPHRWVLQRRIQRACDLLRAADMPLADLALELGFADQSHFTATFRRLTGDTPAAFRRDAGGG